MEELIRVEDIEKYYGSKNNLTKAVDRISFTVSKGEFTGIMGASGSGKTTLLNLLATVDMVTSGHIYYGPEDITRLSEDKMADFRKNNLGFVFQDFNLLDTLTIQENISLAMSLTKKSKKEIQERTKNHGAPGYPAPLRQIPLPGIRRTKAALCLCQGTDQPSENCFRG